MTNVTSIEGVLQTLKSSDEIADATLVSRSGMHISGEVPQGAHLETYVAMAAILLGAAETATGELKEEFRHLAVELKESRLVVLSAGAKALLVLRLRNPADIAKVQPAVTDAIRRIENLI
jgi:predicted regulator of Ras-like GTPase activity (Roadblock/LC7/MglB family)